MGTIVSYKAGSIGIFMLLIICRNECIAIILITPQPLRYCFHPWHLGGQVNRQAGEWAGGQVVGKGLSGLYLRNCKV